MTLKEYIKILKEFEKDYGNLELCYSIDDEGNSFEPVLFSGSVGYFDKAGHDFLDSDSFDDGKLLGYDEKKLKINAICIN